MVISWPLGQKKKNGFGPPPQKKSMCWDEHNDCSLMLYFSSFRLSELDRSGYDLALIRLPRDATTYKENPKVNVLPICLPHNTANQVSFLSMLLALDVFIFQLPKFYRASAWVGKTGVPGVKPLFIITKTKTPQMLHFKHSSPNALFTQEFLSHESPFQPRVPPTPILCPCAPTNLTLMVPIKGRRDYRGR